MSVAPERLRREAPDRVAAGAADVPVFPDLDTATSTCAPSASRDEDGHHAYV